MKIVLTVLMSVLITGCISSLRGSSIKCTTEVPSDHEVIKVEMLDTGMYVPPFKKIFIKKNRHWRAQQKTIRHELCHVTEWKECLPLGTLAPGWHDSEQARAWNILLQSNENCKEKVNEPDRGK